jgi:hypothetical protein
MADSSSKLPSSRLVYDGVVFRIEFYVAPSGAAPAEAWLEGLPLAGQQKFAALFARMGDTGKIWNERKFKHLTETDQIFCPALFMKVRGESVQTRSETGTRRREALRHTRAVCRRAERRDCPSQPCIHACSRSFMNNAG